MNIAFWCVLAASLLPVACAGLAKSGLEFDNARPREKLDQVTGWRQRAHWAQLNGFEAFPPFAAAVIIATMVHVPQGRVDTLALVFIGLRLVYCLLYVADRPTLRSLSWLASTASVIALYVSAAVLH